MVNKPANLLAHAQKHAPGGDGSERETRCAWIVADKDAPHGEWWVAKCCGRVLDSSAKVGGHRCSDSLQPWQRDRLQLRRAEQRETFAAERRALAALPWYRRLW